MAEEIDDIEIDDGYSELLADAQFSEIKKAINGLAIAIAKGDPELKKFLSEYKEVVGNFAKAITAFENRKPPEIKLETNQDKVVDEIGKLTKTVTDSNSELSKKIDDWITESKREKEVEIEVTQRDNWNYIKKAKGTIK